MEMHEKQRKILNRLAEAAARGVSPPTILEFVEFLGVKSPAVVQYHLRKLEEAKLIQRTPGKSRSVQLTNLGKGEVTHRPIPVLGDIAAGTGVLAMENVEESVPMPSEFTGSGDLFMLRVRGDSMIDAGIFNGDHVVARVQPTADPGDLVVAGIPDGEATVKHLRIDGETVVLVPSNPAFDELRYPADEVDIYGRVVTVLRRV